MAFETLNGIVLRYANYRDNDRILTVLTQERGAVAVTVRNCRKKSSVTADAVSEQCCYGEFVVYERGGILYASSTAIKESFYPIREDCGTFSFVLPCTELSCIRRQQSDRH